MAQMGADKWQKDGGQKNRTDMLLTWIGTWWKRRQLARAQRENASLKQECRGEVLRQIQPTAYSKKSVAQLQKLARRGFRKGCEAQAELAQRELNRRGLLGAVSRAQRNQDRLKPALRTTNQDRLKPALRTRNA
jgi:hypothetical protein